MSGALSFIAGMGTGYLDAERRKKEDARKEEADKRTRELQDIQIATARQGQQDRQDLQAAGAPVAVTPIQGPKTAAQIAAEGASFDPAQPAQQGEELGYIAGATLPGARGFAQKGVAQEYANTQATPEARRGRMATLAAQGNTLAGTALRDETQLKTAELKGQAAQLNIDDARAKQAREKWDDGVFQALSTEGPDGLARFLSDSPADGQGGAQKFKAIKNQDGTWQMARIAEDGSEVPFGGKYKNGPDGFLQAHMALSRALPLQAKAAHLLAAEKLESDRVHQAGMLGVAQKNADTNEQYRKDVASQGERRLQIEASRISALREKQDKSGTGPITVGLKDMRDFEGDLDGYIKDQFPVAQGGTPEERAKINAEATAMKALGSSLFRSNAAAGIPLTAGTVLQAIKLAQDRSKVQVAQLGGSTVEAVMVNGQPVIVSGSLQKKPAALAPAAPSAGAQPVPRPAVAQAQRGVQPGAAVSSSAAEALDRARIARTQANATLQQWGSAQRQRDPEGYQRVRAAYFAAKGVEEQAGAAYQSTLVGSEQPADQRFLARP